MLDTKVTMPLDIEPRLVIYSRFGDPRFYQILKEMAELHARKSQDYGLEEDPLTNVRNAEEFGIPAWVGVMLRANDKMRRIKSMAHKGKLVNESLEDSLLDLANYSILALILYREAKQEEIRGTSQTNR